MNLFQYCPHAGADGELRIDHRGQSSVVALGIYFLESRVRWGVFPHKERVMPYLTNLMRQLSRAQWSDDVSLYQDRCLPVPECFAFCLTTLLCDVASLCPESGSDILTFQVDFLCELSSVILENRAPGPTIPKRIVPLLFGHIRAMGRFQTGDCPLFLKMFPKPSAPLIAKPETTKKQVKSWSFYNFRSIIPRSLSSSLGNFASVDKITQHEQSSLTEPCISYFRVFGSSFELIQPECSLQFTAQQLDAVKNIAQSLLDREVLEHFDALASEMFAVQAGKFPYKYFSETLNLVVVALLRELLRGYNTWSNLFMKDVQTLVITLFASGQTELQNRHYEHHRHLHHEARGCSTLTSATR